MRCSVPVLAEPNPCRKKEDSKGSSDTKASTELVASSREGSSSSKKPELASLVPKPLLNMQQEKTMKQQPRGSQDPEAGGPI